MPKKRVVVFTHNNALVLTNPRPEDYEKTVHVVNPDLSELKGISPHFWKLVDGKVVAMTRPEKEARLKQHAWAGVYNTITPYSPPSFFHRYFYTLIPLLTFLIGAALGALLWRM